MKVKYVALLFIIVFAACKSKLKKEVLQVEVAPQDTVQYVEPIPEPVIEVVDEGVNLDDKYFLILNSYTVKEFADSWNEIYRKRGFKSDLIMINEDGYFRLALKSFDNLEHSQKAMDEMKKDTEFSKLWILIK